jgi:radical SAM/Cys-rich protein
VTTVSKFEEKLSVSLSGPVLRAEEIEILQVNVGYKCNMACKHCHIEAGPGRDELMDGKTADAVLDALRGSDIKTLDITGGAPEYNPQVKRLIVGARRIDRNVMVRTNLTVLSVMQIEGLVEFYSDNNVEVIASLPYYIEDNVDRIRGDGTFKKSISALRKLNSLGYGNGSGKLHLVYNPQGAFLPPPQSGLEDEYRRELGKRFGVSFNHLFTFANMPIGRFREYLVKTGSLDKYMERLLGAFNPGTLDDLMCRRLVSIRWDGRLFDCDFNQALDIPVNADCPQHISEFESSRFSIKEIAFGDHCLGCTAGQGST